jgi:cobalamin biosynthetic protein CobC
MNNLSGASTDNRQELLSSLPLHGGDIQAAAIKYGIPIEQWIDLSTGMNPDPYPIPDIPSKAFHNLPYLQTEFLAAAGAYYGQSDFVTVSGTQAAIQALPALLNKQKIQNVLVPSIGYQEHAMQWGKHSNELIHYCADSTEQMIADISQQLSCNNCQHIVIIRPNNPTAVMVDNEQLLLWAKELADHSYLIIDEAFIDTEPGVSILAQGYLPSNVVVFRSFGKFFGLAGLRLGFAFSNINILDQLTQELGIWQVNGPAQFIATKALNDKTWHKSAATNAGANSAFTEKLFFPIVEKFQLQEPLRNPLFLSYRMGLLLAVSLNDSLAKYGVLTRVVLLGNDKALLRLGTLNRLDKVKKTSMENILTKLCKQNSVSIQACSAEMNKQ